MCVQLEQLILMQLLGVLLAYEMFAGRTPRLGEFRRRHPEVSLRLDVSGDADQE